MKPIERIPIVEQVTRNLTEYIHEKQLSPGDKMPTEKNVCEMFGVGRSTVREAYRMMQASGFLRVMRGKGVFFAGFPEESNEDAAVLWFRKHARTLGDYMEVRCAIEKTAIRLAISMASDQDIRNLEKLHLAYIKSASEGKTDAMAICDQDFHLLIAKITKNNLLIRIEEIISECILAYRTRSSAISGNPERAIKSHAMILTAFKEHDPQAGVRAMTVHMANSLIDMQRVTEN